MRTLAADADDVPAGVGPARNATQLPFQLSARVNLQVNVGSGNALVTSDDLDLPGVSGPVGEGLAYNSRLAGTDMSSAGSHGPDWKARGGEDDRLYGQQR